MAEAAVPPLKLLLDEMLDPAIAQQLRRHGWDVESIQRDRRELLGADDATVLESARRLGRVLVTDNVRHFLRLHQACLAEQSRHAGLLLAHPRSYPRSRTTIGPWVRGIDTAARRIAAASMENACEWL